MQPFAYMEMRLRRVYRFAEFQTLDMDIKNARCATKICDEVSETFSALNIYFKTSFGLADWSFSTGKVMLCFACGRPETGYRKLVLQ